MKKKISYVELLKEAISEYDTKSFDKKGPMIDPIISYNGEGELETHKDASSVLERYYFREKENDKLFVEQDESEGKVENEPEDNEIITGEEPDEAGETMNDLEKELMEEFMLEDDDEGGSDKVEGIADVPDEFEKEEGGSDKVEGIADVTESMEQAVLQKLISEMEEVEDNSEEKEKKNDEEKNDEKDEGGEENKEDDEIDELTEELELEMLMLEMEEDEKEAEKDGEAKEDKNDEENDELDVDKELKEKDSIKEDSFGMGIKNSSAVDKVEEAFRLFKEEIDKSDEETAEEKDDSEEDDVVDVDLEEPKKEEDEEEE